MTMIEQDNVGGAVQEQQAALIDEAAAQAEKEAAAQAEKSNDRDYVILKRVPGSSPNSPQTWEFISNVSATSTEQAVRRAAEAPGTSFLIPDGPTTLVAIPVRSFNPLTLTVKTETTVTVS